MHGEKIECGICDYEATDMADVETHLTTCQFYECTNCEEKIMLFTKVKEHFLTMHKELIKKTSGVGIRNYKVSRENSEIYKSEYHTLRSLFPELCEKEQQ